MTPIPVTPATLPRFRELCAREPLYGSRSLCAHLADTAQSFLLEGPQPAALSLEGNTLTVVPPALPDPALLAGFLADRPEVTQVDSTLELCTRLQARLGGELDSSFFMRCDAPTLPPADPCLRILPSPALEPVFQILIGSHPFYQTHLRFDSWAAGLSRLLELGLSEVYTLEAEGRLVGTGRLMSQDHHAGAIGAVAVLPQYRGRDYGTQMSAFLTRRVLELGKTPVLISGYDAVAALYRPLGYRDTGRWGELYLKGVPQG